MSDAKILDGKPASLPAKRKSDVLEENPPCKTLKTQPFSTENHLNGEDKDDPQSKEENGTGKVEALPENGEEGVKNDDGMDGKGEEAEEVEEDYDDDADYDGAGERGGVEGDQVDRKGKGIVTDDKEDDKGKGKMVITEEDYVYDSDFTDDDSEDSDDSDDSDDTDDTEELLASRSDGDLSDDPLAEVDVENILPSRTRLGRTGKSGVVIGGGERKDGRDGDGANKAL